MKKQKTPNRLAYEKEYRRITAAVRRMKKAGYTVAGQIKKPSELSSVRKRDVERLQKLTADELYRRATYHGQPAEIERHRRRSRAGRKAARTRRAPRVDLDRVALEKVEKMLDTWRENPGAKRLKAFLDTLDWQDAGKIARKWLEGGSLSVVTILYEEQADVLITKTQNDFMDSANADLIANWADYYQEWGEIND